MHSLSLIEAADFLKIHPEELRRRAKAGYIPGSKIGRAWVFIREDLVDYIRSQYTVRNSQIQVTLKKEPNKCHFANAE